MKFDHTALSWEIRCGDALEQLRQLPDGSVQCVVTSPPYWGLRDYGTAEWEGGDPGCDHVRPTGTTLGKRSETFCANCGAVRIDDQLGLEETPEEYVARMVEVFREVRRVLRSDGTCWLNLGDSYSGYHGNGRVPDGEAPSNKPGYVENMRGSTVGVSGLKPKDLVGIPWRVAFALQADGWWLRSDIIWSKPNPMPESVRDRPTKAHEYVFLLTKAERYFYDADAVAEPLSDSTVRIHSSPNVSRERAAHPVGDHSGLVNGDLRDGTRNRRTVWQITTRPYPDAHFAVFPPELPEVCIKAGTSEKGCCPECGAPWERVVEVERGGYLANGNRPAAEERGVSQTSALRGNGRDAWTEYRTTGLSPTCDHNHDPAPCTVLDPFAGAGTTGLVALRLRRSFVGIDLSPEYCEMARDRIRDDAPLFNAGTEAA